MERIEMTEAQKQECLRVRLVEGVDYAPKWEARRVELADKLNIDASEVTALYKDDDFKKEVQRIQGLYNSRKLKDTLCAGWLENRNEFYMWYLDRPKICCYCDVSEEQAREYFKINPSRDGRRGKNLEIERLVPKDPYSPDNCRFACYACNNAKSDFVAEEDFAPIAAGIKQFWKNVEDKQ
jgi:hypothetical protein